MNFFTENNIFAYRISPTGHIMKWNKNEITNYNLLAFFYYSTELQKNIKEIHTYIYTYISIILVYLQTFW